MGNKEHQLSASITVEASYVMAVVIMSMAVMIRAASGQCLRTAQVMHLHHMVEQLRYRESDEERTWGYGKAARDSGQVEGYVKTEDWEKEIRERVHEPEEILRLLTIFEGEGGQPK